MTSHRRPTRPSLLPLVLLATAVLAAHQGIRYSQLGLVVAALMLACAALTLAALEDQ